MENGAKGVVFRPEAPFMSSQNSGVARGEITSQNSSQWTLERDAAALARGLESPRDWPQIANEARVLVVAATQWPLEERLDAANFHQKDSKSALLHGAARALDSAAQFAPSSGGKRAREAGLWAAGAYALAGNFPCSMVVLKRTLPRLSAPFSTRGAKYEPELVAIVRAFAPILAARAEALSEGKCVENAALWSSVEAHFGELASVARAASQSVEALQTARWLHSNGGALQNGEWAQFLAARMPILLPPQVLALQNGLLQKQNVLVALPPGTGKTWLGELFLIEALARRAENPSSVRALGKSAKSNKTAPAPLENQSQDKDWKGAVAPLLDGNSGFDAHLQSSLCNLKNTSEIETQSGAEILAPVAVFLVPYVALGRGVLAALRAHLPPEIALQEWMGNDSDEGELERSTVIVATPERFDMAWRSDEKLRARVVAVAVDEAHTLGEGARGVRLEGLIARLLSAPTAPRLLLLSAVIDQFETLARWIGMTSPATVSASFWTPTARRLAFWRGNALDWWADCAGRGLVSLGKASMSAPHAHIEAGDDWVKARRAEPLVWDNVAHLAHELWENRGGATLCLCATRRATRQLARALAQKWDEIPENDGARGEAIGAIETRYRTLLPLARLLKHGVAWHNASLPSELRSLIEKAVQNGEIRALAATRTLAEGVDLPFAQTILADWLSWDEGNQKPLAPALFRNIAGRCGRAGAFCEGDTFLFDNPLGPPQFTAPDVRANLQNELYLGGELPQPTSALDFAGKDLVLQSAFESQFLATLAEGAKAHFYAATSEPEHFALLWAKTLEKLRAQGWIEGENLSPRGLALARADVSPATGLKLLGALESLPRGDWKNPAQWPRLNAYLWRALGASSEAGTEIERFFGARSRFLARPADLESVGAKWLAGTSAEAIFAALGAQKSDKFPSPEILRAWMDGEDESGTRLDEESAQWTQDFDRFLDWLRAGWENWTPRLWRAAGALAPFVAQRDDLKVLDWNGAAARLGVGVPTLWAANVLRSGAPGGREVAAILARHWPFEPKTGDILALAPLGNSPQSVVVAHRAMRRALHEVGGAHCAAGANLKELRDWLWARAGLRK